MHILNANKTFITKESDLNKAFNNEQKQSVILKARQIVMTSALIPRLETQFNLIMPLQTERG